MKLSDELRIWQEDNEETRLKELADLYEGYDIDPDTFQKCADVQLEFRTNHFQNIDDCLDTHTITPEEYLDRTNELMSNMMNELCQILGDEKFDAIFGEAGRHPEGMIDRKIFLGQYSEGDDNE